MLDSSHMAVAAMSGSVLRLPWACSGFSKTVPCDSSEVVGRSSDCAHVVHFVGSCFVCSVLWPVYTLRVGKIVSVSPSGCGEAFRVYDCYFISGILANGMMSNTL